MAVTPGPLRTTLLLRSDPLRLFSELAASGEKISTITLPAGGAFLVHEPELVSQLLLDRTGRIQKYLIPGVADTFGGGLFTSSGERHAAVRQVAQPLFHRVHIEEQAELVRTLALQAIDELSAGENDLKTFFERTTLRIVARVLFGLDATRVSAAFFEAAEVMQQTFQQKEVSPEAAERFAAADSGLDELLRGLLDQVDVDAEGGMLMRALREMEGFTKQVLIDELRSFLLASIPTSLMLATACWLLASHSDVQHNLRTDVNGSSLDCVMQETLRLYPPAWVLIRWATETVPLGEASYPAGSVFFVCLWTLHRSARFFAEPDEFRPSRWNDRADLPRGAFLPFALGNRSCVGERLSRLIAQQTVPLLVRRFHLIPSGNIQQPWLPRITYAPRGGIWVKLQGIQCS